jgi:hypothetical protein
MKAVKRLHIQDLTWQDRLLCGRISYGQEIVPLMAATAYPDLCHKCRDRLYVAWSTLAIRAEPRTGEQLQLFEDY